MITVNKIGATKALLEITNSSIIENVDISFKDLIKRIPFLNDIYEKYQKTLDEDKFKLKGLLKKFENYGGLTDKDKFAMRSSLEMLELSRKQNLATIKEFLEDDIVFYLNKDRILNIQNAIKQEKPLTLLTYVEELEQFFLYQNRHLKDNF